MGKWAGGKVGRGESEQVSGWESELVGKRAGEKADFILFVFLVFMAL